MSRVEYPVCSSTSRRAFLNASGTALAGTTLLSAISARSYAAESNALKTALVGCGGRDTGAAVMDFLQEAKLPAKTKEWCAVLGMDRQAQISFTAPALIVVDMQKDFLLHEGLLPVWGGPAIIPNVLRLIGGFHSAMRPVILTRHIYENPEHDGGATARWWKMGRDSMIVREGTWHAQLHDSLKPRPDDRVIAKRRYSAFYGSDLELILRTSGVSEVVVCGVCTNICCEATAHDALFRDFDVFLVADACGATDEPAHLATLRNFALAYGRPVTTEQVVHNLPKRAGSGPARAARRGAREGSIDAVSRHQ